MNPLSFILRWQSKHACSVGRSTQRRYSARTSRPIIIETSSRRRKPPRRSPALHPPGQVTRRRQLGVASENSAHEREISPATTPTFHAQRHQRTDRPTSTVAIIEMLTAGIACFVSVEGEIPAAMHVPAPVFLCLRRFPWCVRACRYSDMRDAMLGTLGEKMIRAVETLWRYMITSIYLSIYLSLGKVQ
jgi:hypothetical protein